MVDNQSLTHCRNDDACAFLEDTEESLGRLVDHHPIVILLPVVWNLLVGVVPSHHVDEVAQRFPGQEAIIIDCFRGAVATGLIGVVFQDGHADIIRKGVRLGTVNHRFQVKAVAGVASIPK
ncbi:hypothetical protein D3C86_1884420 [compost metagenome]